MINKVRAFRSFSRSEKSLFFRAWWTLLVVHLKLRRQAYREVLRWASLSPAESPPPASAQRAVQVRDMVAKAARHHLCELTCLRQALAACRLLSLESIPTEIKLGVRREENEILAHAWLQVGDQEIRILGSGETDFSELQQRQTGRLANGD